MSKPIIYLQSGPLQPVGSVGGGAGSAANAATVNRAIKANIAIVTRFNGNTSLNEKNILMIAIIYNLGQNTHHWGVGGGRHQQAQKEC
jgi:hypothetical protein